MVLSPAGLDALHSATRNTAWRCASVFHASIIALARTWPALPVHTDANIRGRPTFAVGLETGGQDTCTIKYLLFTFDPN
jgi:hypothetical protein